MLRFVLLILGVSAVTSQIAAQNSQSPQEQLKEAIALQQSGQLDAAVEAYRKLLESYPSLVQVRSNLGSALSALGRYEEAVAEYQRALGAQPDPQIRMNLALAFYKSGQYKPAVEQLIQVRDGMPSNLQAVEVLSDCYLRLGENKKVIDLLRPQWRAAPGNQAIAYMLGTALVRDGQTAEGQQIIDPILKQGDSAEARLLIGMTKFGINDFTGALADLKRAVELNPALPDANAYLGLALLATGDQEAARSAFQKELAANPNNFDANLQIGFLLKQDQDYQAALPFLLRAVQVRPGDIGARFQIAQVRLALGEVPEAQAELESIVKETPNFTEAHVTLATVYYRQKRKADGDRERATAEQLHSAEQARQPAQKAAQ